MKIQFEENLEYQKEAIDAVTGIFVGLLQAKSEFTVMKSVQMDIENSLGIGNRCTLLPSEISRNIEGIQEKYALPQSKVFNKEDYHFSIEMETGTGKTYVYLRTILELYKEYGFTKFIIIVPSIAIKEGVYKTLQITKEHFKQLYGNIPYNYFIYSSKHVEQLRNFAVNNTVQIMIMTIDAINKEDKNIIHQSREQTNGYKPIEYVRSCNPIVILDEPQNMESQKAKEAIKSLNPLCTLRYSATHKEKYNVLYQLNSVKAYQKRLVKQIELKNITPPQDNNMPYIKVIQINTSKQAKPTAELEIDIWQKSGQIKRKKIKVHAGDDIREKAKREIYDGYTVQEIDARTNTVNLGKVILSLGQCNGGGNLDEIKRLQIRATITSHLEKQKKLLPRGIKVLSLFFIDKVSNYREYDVETNEPKKGKYAEIFEEEYNQLIRSSEYRDIYDEYFSKYSVNDVHDGYFSKDRVSTRTGKKYEQEKDTNGKTNADNDTFEKIMRDKEKLLLLNEPLSFIFSHSALKEGWDNPNVFQICTLNETTSEIKKRQEIGRGLRLAVNQNGERVHGFDVNTLTVIANESYDSFVQGLQNEMEKDEGIVFDYIDKYSFSNIVYNNKGKEEIIGYQLSEKVFNSLVEYGYVTKQGKTTNLLKEDIQNDNVYISEEFSHIKSGIIERIKELTSKLPIYNATDKHPINIRKEVLLSSDFKLLWNKIKYKTKYNVHFSEHELIEVCSKAIDNELFISNVFYTVEKNTLEITQGGINQNKEKSGLEMIRGSGNNKYILPDVITNLQNITNLTRKTIATILQSTKTLSSLQRNPQDYIRRCSEIINRTISSLSVDNIEYQKLGDDIFYSQEQFESHELFGYLKNMMRKRSNIEKSCKSPYEYVRVDSDIECEFAQELERSENVLVYIKLPSWFVIPTPLGNYNPDWAILIRPERGIDKEKLYFVAETKGKVYKDELGSKERGKVICGERHFSVLGSDIQYTIVDTFDKILEKL